MAGRVPGHSKAGEQVDVREGSSSRGSSRYVSRGGEKLAHASTSWASTSGRDALDVGASRAASPIPAQAERARVIALDVGCGQLHRAPRDDPRVTVLERVNARASTSCPSRPTFVTCDVSFISVQTALPAVLRLAARVGGARARQPQFEAGRAQAPKASSATRTCTRRVPARWPRPPRAWERASPAS